MQFVPHFLVFRVGFPEIFATETLCVFLTSPVTYLYENGKVLEKLLCETLDFSNNKSLLRNW